MHHSMEEEEQKQGEEEEEEKTSINKSSSISSATSSRWSPTKEQITVLETLYKQGIRTPNADQIQQIAGMLKEYGTIEGKNVFYWFQNHKARQRQKQKQETMACFNRLLRKASSVGPPPLLPHHHQHLPVGCNPYYFPHGHGYYPGNYPNVFLSGGIPKRQDDFNNLQYQQNQRGNERVKCIAPKPEYLCGTGQISVSAASSKDEVMNTSITHETLQLFPLHPTGFLEERSTSGFNSVN